MAFLIHLVCLLARHRFLVLPAFLLLAISGGGVSGRHKTGWRWLAGSLAFANFFGSPVLGAWLLYRVGETASAQVTGTFATWVNINDRDVVGYDVLIRQADGKVISTRFEDDEFTLFPPQNFAYPQPDETFGVRYLPGYPRDFVILTDDTSVWTHRQHCYRLSERLTTARQRFAFARGAASFRADYVSTIDGYLAAGCAENAEVGDSYRKDRAWALSGVVDPAQ